MSRRPVDEITRLCATSDVLSVLVAAALVGVTLAAVLVISLLVAG